MNYCVSCVGTGIQEVRAVHHQNLNKRILIALVACSGLLGGVFLIILYVWFRRNKTLKHSRSKNQETNGMTIFSGETLFGVSFLFLYRGNAGIENSFSTPHSFIY